MAHYLSQANLETALGGPLRARQLLKPRVGEPATEPSAIGVESVLGNVDGCLRREIGKNFDLDSFDALWFNAQVRNIPAPTVPISDMDRTSINTSLKSFGRYYGALEGGEGQFMTDAVRADFERELKSMESIGARLKALGMGPQPGTSRHYKHQQPLTFGQSPVGSHRKAFDGGFT